MTSDSDSFHTKSAIASFSRKAEKVRCLFCPSRSRLLFTPIKINFSNYAPIPEYSFKPRRHNQRLKIKKTVPQIKMTMMP